MEENIIRSLQYFVENTNFQTLLGLLGIYSLFLWLLVPVWVYIDSKRHFENQRLSVLLFILILPFNIPGLIFYIIIRPDEHRDIADSKAHLVNVPIVNFIDNKKDLVMSLELKINSEIISPDKQSDLNLNLTIDSNSDSIEIDENKSDVIDTESSENPDVQNYWNEFKNKIKGTLSKFKLEMVSEDVKENGEEKQKTSEKNSEMKNKKSSKKN